MSGQYDKSFFINRRALAQASAKSILKIIWPLTQPKSALDIGCATGIWLAECSNNGATTIKGVDGPWVPIDELEIDANNFQIHDLSQSTPAIEGEYDIALCIELAEHLTEESGKQLVKLLTSQAEVILFSAAIPGQGGTGHINENKQSYWHEFFSAYHFECFDVIRPHIWDDSGVNVIYKQNMLLYVKTDSHPYQELINKGHKTNIVSTAYELDRVHPDLFSMKAASAVKKPSKTRKIKNAIKGFFK